MPTSRRIQPQLPMRLPLALAAPLLLLGAACSDAPPPNTRATQSDRPSRPKARLTDYDPAQPLALLEDIDALVDVARVVLGPEAGANVPSTFPTWGDLRLASLEPANAGRERAKVTFISAASVRVENRALQANLVSLEIDADGHVYSGGREHVANGPYDGAAIAPADFALGWSEAVEFARAGLGEAAGGGEREIDRLAF
ncbi:MAG: hypothetical protein AAFZ87_10520 [Planctomycetota bacterium]